MSEAIQMSQVGAVDTIFAAPHLRWGVVTLEIIANQIWQRLLKNRLVEPLTA